MPGGARGGSPHPDHRGLDDERDDHADAEQLQERAEGEEQRRDAPDGAILVFLRCWMVLYGTVSMEVFGHLGFALDDTAPMFELTLGNLAGLVGLRYPLPAA